MQILQYIISPPFLFAAFTTVGLTVFSMVLGVLGGLVLAPLSSARIAPIRWFARFYIWLFRGTPVLLQLIFIFNVLPLIGLRFDSFTSAVIALSLNEAAYMAEIVRGGMLGIEPGQRVAAGMLGLTRWQTMRYVLLPQLIRLILPPTGNQVIGMLKTSALASIVAVQDLMLVAQRTAAGNFDYVNALGAAAVLYLILTTIASFFLRAMERRTDTAQKSNNRRKRERILLAAEQGHH